MTAIKHPVVAALFEAHVTHALALLEGDELGAHLAAEIDADLANAAQLKLGDVVTRDLIKATVRTYAIHMPMAGGIPELVGEIARALHAHPIQEETRLIDLISDQQVREMINKGVEMREVRERRRGIGEKAQGDPPGHEMEFGAVVWIVRGSGAADDLIAVSGSPRSSSLRASVRRARHHSSVA